jgi:hypothetical protein
MFSPASENEYPLLSRKRALDYADFGLNRPTAFGEG